MTKLLDRNRAVRIPLPDGALVEILAPHAVGVLTDLERTEVHRGFQALMVARGDPTRGVHMVLVHLLCGRSSFSALNAVPLRVRELPPEIIVKIAVWLREHAGEYRQPLMELPLPATKVSAQTAREVYLRKVAGELNDPELARAYLALAAAERIGSV